MATLHSLSSWVPILSSLGTLRILWKRKRIRGHETGPVENEMDRDSLKQILKV